MGEGENDFNKQLLVLRRGAVVTGLGSRDLGFRFYISTIGIRQETNPEFKVLRCSSKKFGSKDGV